VYLSDRLKAALALVVALAAGIAGTALYFGLRDGRAETPSLYVNGNGRDVLVHPRRHLAAVVRFRGRVTASRELADGALVTLRVDGVAVAAHVYDPSWAPVLGSPLQVEGRVRGALGDPIEACGIPVPAPLRRGSALIDVTAATGPHRSREPAPEAEAGEGDEAHGVDCE